MSRMSIVATLAASLLLSACVLVPTDQGPVMAVAPPLPLIVELGADPYYVHQGYYYHYDANHWRYSNSRSGPWAALPRSHYPRETRFKGRAGGPGEDRDHERRDRR